MSEPQDHRQASDSGGALELTFAREIGAGRVAKVKSALSGPVCPIVQDHVGVGDRFFQRIERTGRVPAVQIVEDALPGVTQRADDLARLREGGP